MTPISKLKAFFIHIVILDTIDGTSYTSGEKYSYTKVTSNQQDLCC